MNSQDQNLLILLAVSFILAVFTFFYQRGRGNSRAISTAKATLAFAGVMALAFLFFTTALLGQRSGMGLEPFVLPPIIFLFGVVASAILGMLVYIIENLRPPATPETSALFESSPSDSQAPLANVQSSDWRTFARESAKRR